MSVGPKGLWGLGVGSHGSTLKVSEETGSSTFSREYAVCEGQVNPGLPPREPVFCKPRFWCNWEPGRPEKFLAFFVVFWLSFSCCSLGFLLRRSACVSVVSGV